MYYGIYMSVVENFGQDTIRRPYTPPPDGYSFHIHKIIEPRLIHGPLRSIYIYYKAVNKAVWIYFKLHIDLCIYCTCIYAILYIYYRLSRHHDIRAAYAVTEYCNLVWSSAVPKNYCSRLLNAKR